MSENKMSLKIDGKEIEFTNGETILQIAERSNIYIPTLCYIEEMTPFGGCRLCTVKIVGNRKPFQTACSTPATNGMEVITNDEELKVMRTEVMQMILSEHPSGCLLCEHKEHCEDLKLSSKEKTGRVFGCFACSNKEVCEVRKIVDYLEIKENPYDFQYRNLPLEREDPFFERDYNLCILCGKCVRVCSELRGISAINFINRGHETKVSTGYYEIPHFESNCQFCGSCVDICPTGVLSAKNTKWVSRTDQNKLSSICSLCSMGCGFDYYNYNGDLMESIPNDNNPIFKGQGCVIGRFCTPMFINNKQRLEYPKIRKDGVLVPRNWEEIILAAKEALEKYKPEEIAVLASPDLTNESAYFLKKFANNIIGTKNIGTITNGDSIKLYFDELRKIPRDYNKLTESNWVLIINSNLQISHPTLLINLKKAHDNGAKIGLINLDDNIIPKETKRLLEEEIYGNPNAILEKIEEYSQKSGKGTIILGSKVTKDIMASAINSVIKNSNISLIPLRSRTNIEGVFNIIKNSEESILKGIEAGTIKCLYTTERIDKEYTEKLDFVILQDIFLSEMSEIANIVFPTCSFIEDSGTITYNNLKSSEINKVANVKGVSVNDGKILSQLVGAIKPDDKALFETISSSDYSSLINPKIVSGVEELNEIPMDDNSTLYGNQINLNSFKYRGEPIINHVEDLQRLVGYKQAEINQREEELEEEKIISDYKILENEEIAPNMYKMVIDSPLMAKKAKPGNFVLVMKNETSERTPITLSDWDNEKGTITLYFQERGYSTRELAEAQAGDYLFSLVGPLGNEIKLDKVGTVLLGGGCYGMGAIWPIAKAAKEEGNKVIVILESRNEYLLFLEDEFENLADKVVYATSDGSKGIKGTGHGKIATAIEEVLKEDTIDQAYFIGCKVMMMEASDATREKQIPTFVSLNTIMLDGTGMCGACRLTVNIDGKTVTKFACVDGPTFDAHIIDWDELIKRGVQLEKEEVTVYRSHACRALTKYQLENPEEL